MALSHIVVHLAMCAAMQGSAGSPPVHFVVTDKVNKPVIEQTARDDTLEFDLPWGVYLARAQARNARTSCSDMQYFAVLADHDRTLSLKLQHSPPGMPMPTLVIGNVPLTFGYAQPAIVLFGKGARCNQPLPPPLDLQIRQENDATAYYATIFPSPDIARYAPITMTMRINDAQGGSHYVRLPSNFLTFARTGPNLDQFDVGEGLMDDLAGKPEDTLLCLRIFETTTEVH